MSFDLFAHEEGVIAEARAFLAAECSEVAAAKAAYLQLLKNYERLFKAMRRLMRISDRTESELSTMAEKQRLANVEIAKKNKELEILSSKLAKYLSPQVYHSIFTGAREVRLASQRKKLTVLFSDIVSFTELTDKMESEDLTHLLNHYLTEMSKVALEHGATIDKYVGDMIMIFYGDPETSGVKEDALSCVKMAIAMQRRLRELADVWRGSGIETPLSCRIGIHTGYCTVGNFGSEDRMDYTIIGSPVNLASRLQREAPVGGILISYETYAHIRDEVLCEKRGDVRVKGFARPVATYEVIDLVENVDPKHRPLRVDLAHLRLELDPRMPAQEKSVARQHLHDALVRLSEDAGDAVTEPTERRLNRAS
jgi:class 3 adenylate cyclase